MSKYLKKFENHIQYENYINSSSAILPNVSICTTEEDVHYKPYVETRVVAKFNVTDTSKPTPIGYNNYISGFSEIEIDGVAQPSVVSAYTFNTTGEHTVKYTLTDPTTIGDDAFLACTSLTSIDIPDSVTSIGNQALFNCNRLTSCTIGSGVTSIGSQAFQSCDFTSIDIPNSVISIGNYAFAFCYSLTSCTIGSGVTTIGECALYDCTGITSITSYATTAPTIQSKTFLNFKTGGTLTVPSGSSGYDVWMGTGNYYLGKYNWTKVEQ